MSMVGIVVGFVALATAGTLVRVVAGHRGNAGWFPIGTFTVNTVGSFLLGFFTAFNWGGHATQILFGIAALGSLTTFSTVAWETLVLATSEQKPRAGVYLVLTVLAGIAAAWLGLELGG